MSTEWRVTEAGEWTDGWMDGWMDGRRGHDGHHGEETLGIDYRQPLFCWVGSPSSSVRITVISLVATLPHSSFTGTNRHVLLE